MVRNVAEGKENIRSVNAGQDCSNTELLIVGLLFKIFIAPLRTKLTLLKHVHPEFLETPLNGIVARFLSSNITLMRYTTFQEGLRSRLNNFQFESLKNNKP